MLTYSRMGLCSDYSIIVVFLFLPILLGVPLTPDDNQVRGFKRLYDIFENCSIRAASSAENLLTCSIKMVKNHKEDSDFQDIVINQCRSPEDGDNQKTCQQLLNSKRACDIRIYLSNVIVKRALSLDFGLARCDGSIKPRINLIQIHNSSVKPFLDETKLAYEFGSVAITSTNMTYPDIKALVNATPAAKTYIIHGNSQMEKVDRGTFSPSKTINMTSLRLTMNSLKYVATHAIVLGPTMRELIIKETRPFELQIESINIIDAECGPEDRELEVTLEAPSIILQSHSFIFRRSESCNATKSKRLIIFLKVKYLEDDALRGDVFAELLQGTKKNFKTGQLVVPNITCCSPLNDWLFDPAEESLLPYINGSCKDINETIYTLSSALRTLKCKLKLQDDATNFNRIMLYALLGLGLALLVSLIICYYCLASNDQVILSKMSARSRSKLKTKRSSKLDSKMLAQPPSSLVKLNRQDKILQNDGRLTSRPSLGMSEAAFLGPQESIPANKQRKGKKKRSILSPKSSKSIKSFGSVKSPS